MKIQSNQNLSQGADLYCSIFFINSQLQKYLSQFEKKNPRIYELLMKQLEQEDNTSNGRILVQENDKKKEEINDEQKEIKDNKIKSIKAISNGSLAEGIVQTQPDDYRQIDKESNTLMKKHQERDSLKDLSEQKVKLKSQVNNDQQEDNEILSQSEILDKQTQQLLQKSKEINQSRDYAIEIECKTVGDFYEQQTIMRIECEKTDYFLIKYPDKQQESIRILDHFQKGQYKSNMLQINYSNQIIKDTLTLNQNTDTCRLIVSSQKIIQSILLLIAINFFN